MKETPWGKNAPNIHGRLENAPKCPTCGKLLDGFTNTELHAVRPTPGSIMICSYCETVMEFMEGPKFVPLTGEKLESVLVDVNVKQALMAIRSSKRKIQAMAYTDSVPDYADVMEVSEFKEQMQYGAYYDDGVGYPVKGGKMDRSRPINPPSLTAIPEDATHVAWFNK